MSIVGHQAQATIPEPLNIRENWLLSQACEGVE